MDLSDIHSALSSKSYSNVADICDELMLKIASNGVDYEQEWPYAIHLLGHIFVDDLNSARFLWKTIPAFVKEAKPEVVAVWKIGQCLWTTDYSGVYASLLGFEWSPELSIFISAFSEKYTDRMFKLLASSYSTISITDMTHFTGMSKESATQFALQNGWTLDQASQMLTVKQQTTVSKQKVDPSYLQRLTEYVFHLEH
ncbi:COP9 signalosome complex subunit [Zostera marina]|uniref:COP9 signalosome complex subunit 8 n=1 Tax=Zostera marina TaxID=29655 RepID=A0A0K9NSU2_ZOSMR|nr:COP9 signalosome complex subunit [Zostera marina]